MTIEQKKEWLYRYQNSQRRQEIILFQIEDARNQATSMQPPGGVRVAPTGLRSDRVADAVQRLDELQRAYDAEVAQGCQIYAEIQTAIESLPDIMQTMTVYYRYLHGMKIDLVCVKLERSASTVTKLLVAALDALEVPEITQ